MNGGGQSHLGVEGTAGAIDIGNNQSQPSMPSPNPQTPSSIPDILISSTLIRELHLKEIINQKYKAILYKH